MKKTIVITGASGGIGEALTEKLAVDENVQLVLICKTSNESEHLKNQFGDNHRCYVADFSATDQIYTLTDQLKSDLTRIDALVHTAGIGVYKPFKEITLENWEASLDINVTAVFKLTQDLLELLKNIPDSLVLTIGSGAGIIPMNGRSAYCASKFALRGLILSLAEEFEHQPQFSLITLGSTLTEFGPLSLDDKKLLQEGGKAYFTAEWVADKLVSVINSDNREVEYTWFPSEYGKGDWQKP